VVALEKDGRPIPPQALTLLDMKMVFGAQKVFVQTPRAETIPGAYKIDPKKYVKELDLTPAEGPQKGKTIKAIYRLDKDRLQICQNEDPDNERPREFVTKPGSGLTLITLERQKP
jgi:uncharacterized protein (TIGR03067 family)